MAYFSSNQDSVQRGAKIAADIFCLLIIGFFSFAFFGVLGGVVALVILEAALLGVDYLVPDEADAPGVAVR